MKKESYESTRDYLINVALPTETRTYKPVAHEQLINLSLEGIVKNGLEIERELYSTAMDGNIASGRYIIKNAGDSEMNLQLIWKNSYNKQLRLSFAVGANILVCTNGMISFRSMSSFKKKHTGEIQTFAPENIPECISMAADFFRELQNDRNIMKNYEVDKRATAEIIGRMFIEEQFIESTQLNILKRELENPTHDYLTPGSLWELYQFTTFALGGIHPGRWMDDHMNAHKFFVDIANNRPILEESSSIQSDYSIPDGQLTLF